MKMTIVFKIIGLICLVLFIIGTVNAVTINWSTGFVQLYDVYGETPGTIKVIDKGKMPNGCVLWFDFSPQNIVYNATSGHYEVIDLSGNGNNGTIYGLTGNVLANSTAIVGNGSVTVDFPYYNNVTQANLTVYWNTTLLTKPTLVTVHLNGNLLGSFIAPNGTTGSYTFTGVQSYIIVNSTNTITYSSNNSILIEKTKFDYDHDLTLVQTDKGWALRFDEVNDCIVVPDSPSLRPTTQLTEIVWIKFLESSTKQSSTWVEFLGKSGYWTFTSYIGDDKVRWFFERPDGIRHSVSNSQWNIGKWDYVAVVFSSEFGIIGYHSTVVFSTNEGAIGQQIADTTGVDFRIWKDHFVEGLVGVVEVYVRDLKYNEIKLSNDLLQNNFRIPCDFGNETSMTIDSVIFDGTNYTITVNVSLPNDGYEHLIYLPVSISIPYPVVATTTDSQGHKVNIYDVGTASYITFNISIPANLTLPDFPLIAFKYNGKYYIAGNLTSVELDPTISIVNMPKGIWWGGIRTNNTITTHSIVSFSTSNPIILRKIGYADSLSPVNISVLKYGREIKFEAEGNGTVDFTFFGLPKNKLYKVIKDGKVVKLAKSDYRGVLTFSWSDWSLHVFLLTPAEVTYYANTIALPIILGVGICFLILALVAELTPMRFDDEIFKKIGIVLFILICIMVAITYQLFNWG